MDRKLRDRALVALGETVRHYRARNDRFERWLDERDRSKRQRTSERLASVGGRGEHQGQR